MPLLMDEITGWKGNHCLQQVLLVSNSMTEMYILSKDICSNGPSCSEMEFGMFDNWASAFGETVTALELSPEGYTLVGR